MDQANSQQEKTPPGQSFDTGMESQKMKQDMRHFREEILKLKAHTDEVRKKTLLSIREGIQKAAKDGLHHTLFPKFQQENIMAQATNDNKEIKNVSNGEDAVAATEKIVAQAGQSIDQVHKAVQSAVVATSASEAAAKKAAEEAQKELSKTEQTIDKNLATSSVEVSAAMNKSQKVVSDLVNMPATRKSKNPSQK